MAAAMKFALQARVVLPGSEKAPFSAPPAKVTGASKPPTVGGKVTVTVIVKPKAAIAIKTLGKTGAVMSRAAFAKAHGPDPASLKLVKAFAAEYGLAFEAGPAGSKSVQLTGSSAAMQKAFGVSLKQEATEGATYRVREGAITLPEALSGHVTAVLGLDNRPQAAPHFRMMAMEKASGASYTPGAGGGAVWFPMTGARGQTIGVIELGGGYKTADITAYFKSLGVGGAYGDGGAGG